MSKFKESLSEKFEIDVDGYGQIFLSDIGKKDFLTFTSLFSLLIRSFVSLFLENVLELHLNISEVHFILTNQIGSA
jgi:hypothetical protein